MRKRTPFLAPAVFRGSIQNNVIPVSKQTRPPITPVRAPFANRTILFFGSSGSASTPVENIAIIGYFEEICDLIRKKHVNLAGFNRSPFLPPVLCPGRGRKTTGCPLLPAKAITSENWGDWGGFWVEHFRRYHRSYTLFLCPTLTTEINNADSSISRMARWGPTRW